MKENYLIMIIGKQKFSDGNEDEVETTTAGTYCQKNNNAYIIYHECDEQNLETKSKVILKIENDKKVVLIKNGDAQSRMTLEEGVWHQSVYSIGGVNIPLEVFASKITSRLNEHGGTLQISYSLKMDSSQITQNEIFVKVKEIEQDHV